MNPDVVYAKTAKGLEEISQRTYRLPARMRSLLIMVDGKVSVGDLLRRSASLDEAAAYLTDLFNEGFVEMKGVGPSQAAAPDGLPVAVDVLAQARAFMLKSLVASLGPDSIHFTAKVENARDMATLSELGNRYIDVIRTGGGSRKADAFRAGLIEFGMIAEPLSSVSPPATAATHDPAEARRLAGTKVTIVRFLLETLGPDADQFTGKIESATTIDDLKRLVARHLELIRGAAGQRKADEFRQLVSQALSN